jgi:hypothetical protein
MTSLTRNRFAVLAPDSDSEQKEAPLSPVDKDPPPSPLQASYSLTLGNQPVAQRTLCHPDARPHGDAKCTIQPASQPSNSAILGSSTSMPALSAISFFGRCFQCHYMSHSQKYCPLRQCKLCRAYGHSEIVCHKLQSQKSSTRAFFSRGSPDTGAGVPPGFSPHGFTAAAGGDKGITFKVTAEDEDAVEGGANEE